MPSSSRPVGRRAQIALSALIAAILVSVAGCSAGEPRPIGPAGVDGLEIPTASPDPRDFVRVIDNPYLPLVAGSEWSYERVGAAVSETITVAVSEETRIIAGVAATEVTTTVAGRRAATSTDFFAQDRSGNVWSFGSQDWLAGVEGAQAGLVMPRTPRVGDGFLERYAAGVAQLRSSVLDTSASASTAYGSWTDLVEVQEISGPGTGEESRRFYAPGVGLVLVETARARTELVSYTP